MYKIKVYYSSKIFVYIILASLFDVSIIFKHLFVVPYDSFL